MEMHLTVSIGILSGIKVNLFVLVAFCALVDVVISPLHSVLHGCHWRSRLAKRCGQQDARQYQHQDEESFGGRH